jgi:hypothetical protein
MLVRWPIRAVWGRDPFVRRATTLFVLFIFGWALVSAVLVLLFDIADVGERFWVLVAIAISIFGVWSIFRTLATGLSARSRRVFRERQSKARSNALLHPDLQSQVVVP